MIDLYQTADITARFTFNDDVLNRALGFAHVEKGRIRSADTKCRRKLLLGMGRIAAGRKSME
jgi:hypothetical protein